MSLLGYPPRRRGFLRALGVVLLGAPLAPLARLLARRQPRRPRDLPPIPWIGHC